MRFAVVATLLCLAVPARADVLKTLERGVKWVGKKSGNRTLTLHTWKGKLELDPDGNGGKGRILLTRFFSQRGFLLDENGQVEAGGREQLAKLFGGKLTGRVIHSGIRRAQQKYRVEAARLAGADGQIDALLVEAKKVANRDKSGDETALHDGRRAYVTFRHGGSGPILILTQGVSQHGIFLKDDGKGGFAMHPQDRADLAAALLAN